MMNSPDVHAYEVVTLARSFRDPRGRPFIEANFPRSVVDLYDAVVLDLRWQAAENLTDQGLVVAAVLRDDAELSQRYRADVESGLLGFGDGDDDEMDAAMADVERVLGATAAPRMDPPDVELVESAGPDDFAGDGLLGGDEPSTQWHPPAEPTSEAVETYLNAQIDNDGRPLAVMQKYAFDVSYGAKNREAQAAVLTTVFFPGGSDVLDVSVQLVSADFDVPKRPQILTLAKDGTSDGSALFQVTPLHAGPSILTVVVDVKGNFLQRVDVTYDVGAVDAAPDVVTYGRPVGAAGVLEKREARLEFFPAVGGYEVHAPQLFPNEKIRVLITPDELSDRIEGVRKVLLDWVQKREIAKRIDLDPVDSEAFLTDLAEKGFRLFQAIFRGPEASDSLRAVGNWLRESLADDMTTLQVVSTGFPVPWPLMYLTERFDAAPLSWDNFIGMRHVVEQIRMTASTLAPPPVAIDSAPELTVRTIYNEGIDQEIPGGPVAGQREYWSSRGVALTVGSTAEDLMKSALSASATDKVLYLYCHATAAENTDDSTLTFTGRESVTLGRLWLSAPDDDQLTSRPLVFLNACESADMSPNFYDGFIRYFEAKGARGVIGTECKTPGLFAAEWAKAFFDEFFAGKPLGEVVLTLRRRFRDEHNNPLGLLYGVHCDTDTVISPALTPHA